MTSIFRKLTGRRKKTKAEPEHEEDDQQQQEQHQNCQTISVSTSADSSHASELEHQTKGSSLLLRPQHDLLDSVENGHNHHQPQKKQKEHTSKPEQAKKGNSGGNNHSQRNLRSRSRSNDRSQEKDKKGENLNSSSSHHDKTTINSSSPRRRFSFKPFSLSSDSVAAESVEYGVSGAEIGTSSPKRGRKPPRIKEDHEIYTPPGMKSKSRPKPKPKRLDFKAAKYKSFQKLKRITVDTKPNPVTPTNKDSKERKGYNSTTSSEPLSSSTTKSEREVDRVHKEAERTARAAAALDSRGNEYFERGYFDKAMEAYTKALKLKRRTFHSLLEEADDLLTEDDKLENGEMDPKLLVSMATSINNIGYLRQRSGEATPDETMAAYKKSLKIKRKILGNDSLSVGKTLNNIGSVYYLKKDYAGALPAYEEAYQIMKSNLGAEHPDVATVSSNMGDVFLAMGDRDKSIECYRNSLNVRWNSFGEKDARTARLLEKIARIEIGDSMPTPRRHSFSCSENENWDDRDLFDLGMRPLTEELHLLHSQCDQDIQYIELLQKKMAVDIIKDKVHIMKGMRELIDAQEKRNAAHRDFTFLMNGSNNSGWSAWEDSNRESDDGDARGYIVPHLSPKGRENRVLAEQNLPQTENSDMSKEHLSKNHLAKEPTPEDRSLAIQQLRESRDLAKQHIQERLARLRSKRSSGSDVEQVLQSSFPDLNGTTSKPEPPRSTFLGASFYASGQRPALSEIKPEDLKDKVADLRSALKLKKGIDSLRTFTEDDEIRESDRMVRSSWLGELTGELAC